MRPSDRRFTSRVPLHVFFNQYIHDRPVRAMTTDVSSMGLLAQVVDLACPPGRATDVGIELELPGTGEIIWARGRVCRAIRNDVVRSAAICFVAMARRHARLVHEFCAELRRPRLDPGGPPGDRGL